jgi:hypothetical protein
MSLAVSLDHRTVCSNPGLAGRGISCLATRCTLEQVSLDLSSTPLIKALFAVETAVIPVIVAPGFTGYRLRKRLDDRRVYYATR